MTVVIWGLQFPVAKSAFEVVNAFHSAIFRFGVPACILVLMLLIYEGRSALVPTRSTLRMSLPGVLGMSATPSLIFGGLMFTRPEIAAIIVATQPIMTVVAQRFAGGTRPGIMTLSCVLIAFLGVITVVTQWKTDLNLGKAELIGNLMVFTGAFGWVIYTIILSRYKDESSLRISTWHIGIGTIANSLLVVVLVGIGVIDNPSAAAWYEVRFELIFLAFVGVLVAMTGWNAGARLLGPLNAMLFINLIPVVTFTVRYWQGYRFTVTELVGAGMVIGALIAQNLVLRYRLKHPKQ